MTHYDIIDFDNKYASSQLIFYFSLFQVNKNIDFLNVA